MSYDLADTELVDDRPFFAPVASDLIDGLLGQYQSYRSRICRLALMLESEHDAIHYFLEGNKDQDRFARSVDRLFDQKGAIAALNSAFWSKALDLTDVFECMPKARRDEWSKSMREHTAPDFTEQAVRPTIEGLLLSRDKFFAERVDGIFRGLSGEHVTNAPEAFGRRMIFGGMCSEYGHYSYDRAGLPVNVISGRANELRAAGKLELGLTRRCSCTGRTVHPVRIPSGPAQRGLFV